MKDWSLVHSHFVNQQPPAMVFNPGCGPTCKAAHIHSCCSCACANVQQKVQWGEVINQPATTTRASLMLPVSPLPVRYKARPVCVVDLEFQLKIRGYNSQANYFPIHYSSISSSVCYFSCHFATFQSFAVKQINHLHDLLFGSTYTQLKKTRVVLEWGQHVTRMRLTRTGSLWLISCHSLTAI